MSYVETSAGRVWYTDQGEGPPVVLLSANLHDHTDYETVTGPLVAAGYRTVAVDWPGHGQSDPPVPPGTVTAAGLADVLGEVAARLDLGPAFCIGNSVGGYAAARLALDRPDLVAGLVLVNTGGFIRPTPLTRAVCRILGTPWLARRLLPVLVPRYMRPGSDPDLQRITGRVQGLARTPAGAATAAALWRSFADPSYDLRAQAPRLAAPVLLICGVQDVIYPRAVVRQTYAAIPGSTLRTFPTGHVVFAADPDGFLAEVLPFLTAVTSRSGT